MCIWLFNYGYQVSASTLLPIHAKTEVIADLANTQTKKYAIKYAFYAI